MPQPADEPHLVVNRVGRRRVTTKSESEIDEPDTSSQASEPQEEGAARVWDEGDDTNDQRLKNDKPPHW